jgi:hypothetical protein
VDSQGRPETWRELRDSLTPARWWRLLLLAVAVAAVAAPAIGLAWLLVS